MRSETCDILVIGSGIAGVSFALNCAELFADKKIVVLSKGPLEESNTRYAQGGIAAVMDRLTDSYEKHIEDTLAAGDSLCDKEVVKLVVTEAPRQMMKLMEWGVSFDHNGNQLELGREGGHSANRILHCKDHTGQNIGNSLLQKARETRNICLLESHAVLRLNQHNGNCTGALVLNSEEIYTIQAHYTLMASGGAGQLYELTSNPAVATGDGMALAAEAGANLENMAFVQFHPTVLYEPGVERPFLISEAVRGFGAILRNHAEEDFMYRYDHRGSLATRDIVSRAIFQEMKSSGAKHLWLDLRDLDRNEFEAKFPTIAQKLKSLEIDIQNDMIPVVPAAHYFCGGIATDQNGCTSVGHLLACGECASTGLHGANRLASNSLLEALVFARQAALYLQKNWEEQPFRQASEKSPEKPPDTEPITHHQLQNLMTTHVGIVRTERGLLFARSEVEGMMHSLPETDFSLASREWRSLLTIALAVIDDSLKRNENRGGFFREDLAESQAFS